MTGRRVSHVHSKRGEQVARPSSLMRQITEAEAAQISEFDSVKSARDRLDDIIQRLFDTSPQTNIALRVMQAADDPNIDSTQLATIIELDPFLALRVLRLANTAYYGLQQHVSVVKAAVTVIGFSAVRSIAAMAAIGIGHTEIPPGFLAHSAKVAVGAAQCARIFGEPAGDAFSGGLLHDIGEALLFRTDPVMWSAGQMSPNARAFEGAAFGMDHTTAGHLVMQAWRLPESLLGAVGRHHDPVAILPPLARSIAVAEAVILGDGELARSFGIDDDQIDGIARQIDSDADSLQAWLQNG